jgi:hypothetical protein
LLRFDAGSAAQVLSQSAEKSLVAFLTKADHAIHHKLSAAQIALGRELRAARARKAVVAGKGPAAHQARHKRVSAEVRRRVGGSHIAGHQFSIRGISREEDIASFHPSCGA